MKCAVTFYLLLLWLFWYILIISIHMEVIGSCGVLYFRTTSWLWCTHAATNTGCFFTKVKIQKQDEEKFWRIMKFMVEITVNILIFLRSFYWHYCIFIISLNFFSAFQQQKELIKETKLMVQIATLITNEDAKNKIIFCISCYWCGRYVEELRKISSWR